MIKISPSVLACDFSRLGEEVVRVEKAGADLLHLDVMDGMFVPNISFGPDIIKSVRKQSNLIFDVHLMIENPGRYISKFVQAGADIITIHCPLNDESRGLIDKNRISLMKKDVVIVNEARGAVVNEADIADAVKNKTIGAFGSDVYSQEPFTTDHPFYEIKDFCNVLFTPHAAWGSYEARKRCIGIICENIASYLASERKNRVD